MKKLFSRFTGPEILVGCLVIGILVSIAAVGYSVYLYHVIVENKEAGMTEAEAAAFKASSLVEVESIDRYHGSNMYYSLTGQTEQGEKAVAFVPGEEADPTEVQTFLLDGLLSSDQILSLWKQECSSCRLIEHNLALESGKPLLEVIYISENDRYVFQYYNLENGKTFERLPLKRSLY